jgi:hypothetical protein
MIDSQLFSATNSGHAILIALDTPERLRSLKRPGVQSAARAFHSTPGNITPKQDKRLQNQI